MSFTKATAAVLITIVVGGCGGGHSARPPRLVTLVPGPASRYERVTVTAGDRTADAPDDLRSKAAPLVAPKTISAPGSLAEFGLDHPTGRLTYRPPAGASIDITVGGSNFDHHGFYVQRAGDGRVYFVLADPVRSLLALVGVDVAPPA